MRPYPLFFTAPFIAVLAGCGADTGGDTTFNPATDVNLVFSTFDLTDPVGGVENLKHTRFHDIYRGIEPGDPDSVNHDLEVEIATALRDHLDDYLQFTRNEAGTDYDKARNPLDLVNQVIASGEVANFNDGRRYISERIDMGQAGTYSIRQNGAKILFSDETANLEGQPRANRQWIYDDLNWTYVPNNQPGNDEPAKVNRVVQYTVRDGDSENATARQQLTGLVASSQFRAANFSTVGYNAPDYALASFSSRTLGMMELRQDFIDEHTDILFLSEASGVEFDGKTWDCVRAELDYDFEELVVYVSQGEPATIDDDDDDKTPEVVNPEFCGQHEENRIAYRYTTIAIAERK